VRKNINRRQKKMKRKQRRKSKVLDRECDKKAIPAKNHISSGSWLDGKDNKPAKILPKRGKGNKPRGLIGRSLAGQTPKKIRAQEKEIRGGEGGIEKVP